MSRNMNFGIYRAYIQYTSAYFVRSLCTKYFFKVSNYKLLPRAETLRLCVAAKFNKNEVNGDM
jgi:hypothetical protein